MTTRRVILILVALTLVLAATASVAVAAPQASYSSCVAYHTVRYGDNLNSISRMYGVSVQALMAANGIRSGADLKAGKRLTIPG